MSTDRTKTSHAWFGVVCDVCVIELCVANLVPAYALCEECFDLLPEGEGLVS